MQRQEHSKGSQMAELSEREALAHEDEALRDLRAQALAMQMTPASASSAAMLRAFALASRSTSIILIGRSCFVEAYQLIQAMYDLLHASSTLTSTPTSTSTPSTACRLTIVDTRAQGNELRGKDLVRAAIDASLSAHAPVAHVANNLPSTRQLSAAMPSVRVVRAPVATFLSRLNNADYDMIIVAGDIATCQAAFSSANRLLRPYGTMFFLQATPVERPTQAIREFIDAVYDDDAFFTAPAPLSAGSLMATKCGMQQSASEA